MSKHLSLSIVVATHNRSRLLAAGLAALSQQNCQAERFEVLVVADSCTDDTPAVVASFARSSNFRVRLLAHEARNPSATRNLGAKHAEAETILFIDDDLIAGRDLVRVHAELAGPNEVVIGYAKPKLPERPCLVQLNAARWWEDRFREMRRPGYRFGYLDCFSCNISVPTALFHDIGGFDTGFTEPGIEDYELGVRLINAGARFSYAPAAMGDHHEITDLPIRARRIQIEGIATVRLCRRHPQLINRLLWNSAEPPNRGQRLVRAFALACGKRGHLVERLIVSQAALLEKLRLRYRYRMMMGLLYEFNFWRGVSIAVGGRRQLTAWIHHAEAQPTIACDLPMIDMASPPPPPVLQDLLTRGTSSGIRVKWKGVEIFSLAPAYGCEPLRWEHLERAMYDQARRGFVPALGLDVIYSGGGAPF